MELFYYVSWLKLAKRTPLQRYRIYHLEAQCDLMPHDNDEENESEDEEFSLDSLGSADVAFEEYLRLISFELCQTIRKAGSVYRDKDSLTETANELGISTDGARKAVAAYIHIHTYNGDPDADMTFTFGEECGLRYFRDSEVDPEDILEDIPWEEPDSPEEVRENIRIFVAHRTKDIDLEGIDLNQDIPQTPNRTLPSTRILQASQVVQEVAIQMNADLEETIQNIMQPLHRALQEIDFEAIREHQRIRSALQSGIYGFDSPSSYNPNTTSVDEETKSVGMVTLANFISNVKESDINEIEDYIDRLEYGLERYEEEDYIASTLVFLSVQDGFLDLINQQTGNPPSRSYYTYPDRQDAFENEFPEIFGIQSRDVASQWNDFLDHRHKIMHGDPDAHLDENIASVSLIFLVLAVYTALDLLNVN